MLRPDHPSDAPPGSLPAVQPPAPPERGAADAVLLGRRTLYGAVLLAFALVVAALVFHAVVTVLLMVLLMIIVAIPVAAVATRLERHRIPRPIGALVGMLGGLAILAGIIAGLVPSFIHEVNHFVDALPRIVDDLRRQIGHVTGTTPTDVGHRIQHFISGYTSHPTKLLGPATTIGLSAAGVIAALIVILLTAYYTAMRPDPLVAGAIRLVPPSRRAHAEHIMRRLSGAYLGWLRGLGAGMVVLGVVTYLGLRLIGMPYAVFFAILTALAMVVPYFGALASMIPPILLALTISPGKALLVLIIYLVAHQLEGNVIEPLIMARAVELHPALVAVGVIAVERLFGLLGLILAVPILVTIKILVEELWVRPMEARATSPPAGAMADVVPAEDEPVRAARRPALLLPGRLRRPR